MEMEIQTRCLDDMEMIYKKVPYIKGKGLCHEACGPIAVSKKEYAYMIDRLGYDPFLDQSKGLDCPSLVNKKCSIYENRPLICRLYGVAEKLKCPFGCKPTRYLKEKRARALIKQTI